MKQAILLLALVIGLLEGGKVFVGQAVLLPSVFGAIAMMALMISGTFLWLWGERATPLALGMSFSWLGAGLFAGWWWLHDLLGRPNWVYRDDAALGVLGLCVVGAILHFAVIHRSFGRHGASFLWPVLTALALSAGTVVVVRGM